MEDSGVTTPGQLWSMTTDQVALLTDQVVLPLDLIKQFM